MPFSTPRIVPCSEAALVVEFGDSIDEASNAKVLALDRALSAAKISGVIEAVPTYRSLLVHYDPLVLTFAEMSACMRALAASVPAAAGQRRRWRIPVVYGGEYGIDLEDVAKARGMTPDEVIRLHTGGDYYVAMLGFLPGFAYLAGLDPQLATPRRADPRTFTPAGTISIGGVQALVASIEAPSGWHLLGRTPVRNFMLQRDPVFILEPGDRVVFAPIRPDRWEDMDRAAEAGELVAEAVA
jgi:KipI family sensor histidine kinase inhibitor